VRRHAPQMLNNTLLAESNACLLSHYFYLCL